MKRFSFLLLSGLMAAFDSGMAASGQLDTVRKCAVPNGKVLSAVYTDASEFTDANRNTITGIPPRTIVKLLLQPAKGSNINVEVWLPDAGRWNGRFVGLGNGGAAGSINPAGFIGWIKRGYAVAATDMGTAPNDNSGVGNPEVWKDFGYRATHLMTTAARQLIQSCYGKPPAFSYFVGASTGGQQALQEAQRYPDDYDGIVANVPAHCRTPLHAYFLWNWQLVRRHPLTPEQDRSIMRSGIEYMAQREIPQLAGKAVSDPRVTPEEIEGVIALAMKNDPSLTPEHAGMLRKIFNGPVNSAGERIFNGVPVGSSILAATGHLYLFRWAFGLEQELAELNFDADMDAYTKKLGPVLNAENPDLSAFARRGGRLVMFSGTADSIVPYHATLDYYERCAAEAGSPEKLQEFFVYYLVPGMEHGINGVTDPFSLLVNWCEKGIRPGEIRLKRQYGEETVDIPLYPYPQKTGYAPERGFFPEPAVRGAAPVAPRYRPEAAE